MPVELGSVTLEHLTEVDVRERARIVRHAVPGLSGDLSQTFGRSSVEVRFRGIFYGTTASDDLNALRQSYLERQPVDFYTEAVGEGYFSQVLITRLDVSQRAGHPDQFDFDCEVMEYVEPPEPAAADPFGALNTDLLGEAVDFVDDIQSALAEVSALVDLIANFPDFSNPTEPLESILDGFSSIVGDSGGAIDTLTSIRDLFGP
jgi:hypothetical protein